MLHILKEQVDGSLTDTEGIKHILMFYSNRYKAAASGSVAVEMQLLISSYRESNISHMILLMINNQSEQRSC